MTNIDLLKMFNMPIVTDLNSLSEILLLSNRLLYNLSRFTDRYYKSFTIPKKDGKERIINSPKSSLRVVQAWILRSILEKIQVHAAVMGFRKGYGIKTNAESHLENVYLLKLDIEDFFPTINRKMVFPVFKNHGYSNLISNILTDYCLLNGELPQGASTSPYLSNIVFKDLDCEIGNICNQYEIIYTRYADDMTFSCDNKTTLNNLYERIKKLIQSSGFTLNEKKTKLMKPTGRQIITGLVINNAKVRIKKLTRHRIRSMIYQDIIKGDGNLSKRTKGYLTFLKYIEGIEVFNKFKKYEYSLHYKKQSIEAAYSIEDI